VLCCDDIPLRALDVSRLRHLHTLSCDNCGLQELVLGPRHPKLSVISCAGNELTSLSLVGTPALRTLLCSGNQLTSLDLSVSALLFDVDCCMNRLTDIPGLSGAGLLRSLHCCCNKLRRLWLGEHPDLINFGCGNNPLHHPVDITGCPLLDVDAYAYAIRRDE
jgi:hypothetical protein